MEKNKEKTLVRAVADYQLFDDVEGMSWMEEILRRAMTEGKIKGFDVFDAVRGRWGIQFVSFSIDAELVPAQLENSKEILTAWLNSIIGDSNVEVRWVDVP